MSGAKIYIQIFLLLQSRYIVLMSFDVNFEHATVWVNAVLVSFLLTLKNFYNIFCLIFSIVLIPDFVLSDMLLQWFFLTFKHLFKVNNSDTHGQLNTVFSRPCGTRISSMGVVRLLLIVDFVYVFVLLRQFCDKL